MRHPKLYEMAGMMASALGPAPETGGWIREVPHTFRIPPVRAWLSQRDLPPAPPKSFRQLWRSR
jgi:hypothetical protein